MNDHEGENIFQKVNKGTYTWVYRQNDLHTYLCYCNKNKKKNINQIKIFK